VRLDVSEGAFEGGRSSTSANGRRDPSDVSGKLPNFRSPSGLEGVVAAFDELLLLPDHGAVHIALAGVVANYADGDPVWPLLVGPPGSGKTEIINSITSAPGVWALSSLTPQTLLSGFERKGEPASLLLQIGSFGILAFKDLTTVLTMHREARAARSSANFARSRTGRRRRASGTACASSGPGRWASSPASLR
jgi:hypothetical protein